MSTAPAAAPLVVRPLRVDELPMAARRLFAIYRAEPRFAELYGVAGSELDGTRAIFELICRQAGAFAGLAIGCFRGGRLLGVICFWPQLAGPVWPVWLRHPLRTAWLTTRLFGLRLLHRPRLPSAAARRWRVYSRLARRHVGGLQGEGILQVLALGVEACARRQGVARRLLDAVAADPRFAPHAQWLVVNTWHADNVAVYERLHFDVDAHDVAHGVDCWTMVRPSAAAGEPASTTGTAIDERRDVSAPGS